MTEFHPWMYKPRTDAELIELANKGWKDFQRSPLYQRWLGIQEVYAEAELAEGMARLRTSSLLRGSAELAATLAVTVAVWIGVFASLGAPYLEAEALVKHKNFQSGFSQGFVMGLLEWQWQHLVSLFFVFRPAQINPFDESLSFVAANALNEGLRAGYVHACNLKGNVRKALLGRLRALSPSTKAGNWDRLHQRNYVVELAGVGWRYGIFTVV